MKNYLSISALIMVLAGAPLFYQAAHTGTLEFLITAHPDSVIIIQDTSLSHMQMMTYPSEESILLDSTQQDIIQQTVMLPLSIEAEEYTLYSRAMVVPRVTYTYELMTQQPEDGMTIFFFIVERNSILSQITKTPARLEVSNNQISIFSAAENQYIPVSEWIENRS